MGEETLIKNLKKLRSSASKGLSNQVRKANECPVCFDTDGKRIISSKNKKNNRYECKVCGFEWY